MRTITHNTHNPMTKGLFPASLVILGLFAGIA